MNSMTLLVIGYGNPLRGDDGVGWRVVEEIRRRQADGQLSMADGQWATMATHQLLPELAEPVSAAAQVIFVDAAVGPEPGAIRCTPITAVPVIAGAFTHQMTPAGLLGYAEWLYGRSPTAYLITITVQSMGYEETLSPPAATAVEKLVPLLANGRFPIPDSHLISTLENTSA